MGLPRSVLTCVAGAAAMVAVATITASTAVGATGVRTVNFGSPGATYEASTVSVFPSAPVTKSDWFFVHGIDQYSYIGGVRLTAVGTNTSRGEGADPAANIRGFLPRFGGFNDGFPDMCSSPGAGEPIGQARLQKQPKRNGVWQRVKWTWAGCGDGLTDDNFPVASGVTTYTISKYRRVIQPAVYRTYFQGSDGYFNICLSSDHIGDIVQKNGRLSCTVTVQDREERVSFRYKQTTKISTTYPAYVCPGEYPGSNTNTGCN